MMQSFINFLISLFGKKPVVTPPPVVIKEPEVVVPPQPTNSDKLYEFAKASLDKDIAKTQNELGCAEAVSFLLNKMNISDFPKAGFLGTAELYVYLFNSPHFKRLNEPVPGCVVISPTGKSTKNVKHGHTGITGKFGIMSNDSATGLWKENYTVLTWDGLFRKQLGFPVYFFELI